MAKREMLSTCITSADRLAGALFKGVLIVVCLLSAGVFAQSGSGTASDIAGKQESQAGDGEIEALPFDELPLYKVVGLRKYGVLNFRVSPVKGARITYQIPAGFAALPIVEKTTADGIEWALVRYCDSEGWVALEFLELQEPGEDRVQRCAQGLVDPFPKTKLPDQVAEITLDSSTVVADETALDVLESERDLGQATLSPAYALCLSDAGRNKSRQTVCLTDEYARWVQDMEIAFNLVAATLPFNQMKILRDSQRLWIESQENLCEKPGLSDAEPFTRFHVPTCNLKLTFQRAIALEEMLQDEAGLTFEERLAAVDNTN